MGEELTRFVFDARQRGEMSQSEYLVFNANWVADNSFKYAPKLPVLPSDRLIQYVGARRDNRQPYDPLASKKLGEWLYAVRAVHLSNKSEFEFLRECITQLESVRLDHQANKLRSLLEDYVNIDVHPIQPDAEFVAALDASAKRHGHE